MSSSYVTQLDNISFFDKLIEWIYKSVKEKSSNFDGKGEKLRFGGVSNKRLFNSK